MTSEAGGAVGILRGSWFREPRGESLAEALEGLGYSNVRVYRGGIEDWVAAGLPVHGGA